MISQISGVPIHRYSPSNFSHILNKGSWPRMRYFPGNIVIKTFEEHQLWEQYRHKVKDKREWSEIFELEETLTRLYNHDRSFDWSTFDAKRVRDYIKAKATQHG